MKKFLSLAIVAAMLFASISLVVSAEKPKAENFTANNGFFLYEGKAKKTETRDKATLADTPRGVQVKHGGYYSSGDNCGGVYTTEKYDLNGFEATIYFEVVPDTPEDADCWIAIDFLRAPGAFYTNKFDVNNGGNQGILHLIRYQGEDPSLQVFEGVTKFAQVWSSANKDAPKTDMFRITSGTTLIVKVTRNENGNYNLTFSRRGYSDYKVPYEYPMRDVFVDGKAHFSVIASNDFAGDDAWTYYITDIKNGKPMTEDEAAAIEALRTAEKLAVAKEEATKAADLAKGTAKAVLSEAEALENEGAVEKANEALKEVEAAYAAIESGNIDEANAKIEAATKLNNEVRDRIDNPDKYVVNNTFILTIGKTEADVFGEIKTNDVAPIIENSRTMLPARFVAENLGATVGWNGDTQCVTITKDSTNIEIYIGKTSAYVNGEEFVLDSPAFIRDSRTFTPVRFICEKLGADVDWDGEKQQVIITRK